MLKELDARDISQNYLDWMNDMDVVRFTESRFKTHTLADLESFVASHHQSEHTLLLGIFLADSMLHVGNIKLGPVNWHHLIGDIGIIVGVKSVWGRGVATAAIKLLCDYAFFQMGLRKVTASCYNNNIGSVRAFQKAGFTIEAERPFHYLSGENVCSGIEMGAVNPLFLKASGSSIP